jgi:hypothetical protein
LRRFICITNHAASAGYRSRLEELIEHPITNYNGTPHGGLNNVTPLEAMEYFMRGRQTLTSWAKCLILWLPDLNSNQGLTD